jgi:hypothetical protein
MNETSRESQPYWSTGLVRNASHATSLKLHNNGMLCMYDSSGAFVWCNSRNQQNLCEIKNDPVTAEICKGVQQNMVIASYVDANKNLFNILLAITVASILLFVIVFKLAYKVFPIKKRGDNQNYFEIAQTAVNQGYETLPLQIH